MNFKLILFNVHELLVNLKKKQAHFYKEKKKNVMSVVNNIHQTMTRIAKKLPSILIRNIIITVPSRVNPL